MSRLGRWTLWIAVLGFGPLVGWWLLTPGTSPPPDRLPDLAALIGPDPGGFETPSPGWVPELPADHGAHPGFRTELWTLSGQLRDQRDGHYGFQLSVARLALRSRPVERQSAWAANQLYRAHFTLAVVGADGARSAERLSREALGLAGSEGTPARVWVRDWSLAVTGDGSGLVLRAGADGVRLELALEPVKIPVPGAALDLFPGRTDAPAFNLYLLPRLLAQGRLNLDGETLEVEGTAMLDHAWGSIPAARGQLGLNRFALQLDDGRELLCIELRRTDGTGTPIPSCALILADGRVQSFRRREIDLEPIEGWRSPRTDIDYPVAWRLAIRPLDLELTLSAITPDQELNLSARLWSGAVLVSGAQSGTEIAGNGRIELTTGAAPGAQ